MLVTYERLLHVNINKIKCKFAAITFLPTVCSTVDDDRKACKLHVDSKMANAYYTFTPFIGAIEAENLCPM